MYTMSYIVSIFLPFISLVYATSKSAPTLMPDHPSPAASTNLLELLAVYGGSYSNKGQLAGKKNNTGQHHTMMDLFVIPLDIPAFSKNQKITVLLRQELNGAVYRKELLEFIEEENEVIRAKRYNLTSNSAYNNRPLEELQPNKLETNRMCDALFQKVESGLFVASFPNCRLSREGQKLPAYIGILSCSTLIAYTTAHAAETPNAMPYILKKTDSFPLPEYLFRDKYSDYTYDFVNPCKSKQGRQPT